MTRTENTKDRKSILWLKKISDEISYNVDIINEMPINVVRNELSNLGLDNKKFHSKLSNIISKAKTRQTLRRINRWVSPLWEPQWAGEIVTALDIPEQHKSFTNEESDIEISCYWRNAQDSFPAYIQISWQVKIVAPGELTARFVNPQTQEILCDLVLGKEIIGSEKFTSDDLGFDPSSEKWGLSILINNIE